MRLIDADALRERMYHDAFEMDSDMQKWESGCWIRYKMFENAIEDAPTVEPRRKKGHWVGIDDEPCEVWECDVCGCVCEDWTGKPTYNYCPNCGADMREEKSENENNNSI